MPCANRASQPSKADISKHHRLLPAVCLTRLSDYPKTSFQVMVLPYRAETRNTAYCRYLPRKFREFNFWNLSQISISDGNLQIATLIVLLSWRSGPHYQGSLVRGSLIKQRASWTSSPGRSSRTWAPCSSTAALRSSPAENSIECSTWTSVPREYKNSCKSQELDGFQPTQKPWTGYIMIRARSRKCSTQQMTWATDPISALHSIR